MNQDNFELNENNIEALLHDAILDGNIEIEGIDKHGELTYDLSKKGKERAEDILGGKDVAQTARKLMSVLVKYKALGFDVPKDFSTFIVLVAVLRIFKWVNDWRTLIRKLDSEDIDDESREN